MNPTLQMSGSVRYNGVPASQLELHRTAAYVDQYSELDYCQGRGGFGESFGSLDRS